MSKLIWTVKDNCMKWRFDKRGRKKKQRRKKPSHAQQKKRKKKRRKEKKTFYEEKVQGKDSAGRDKLYLDDWYDNNHQIKESRVIS